MAKLFLIREARHYASDYTIMDTIARYKRLTGKTPTNAADIVMFEGDQSIIEEVTIDDMGDIHYNPKLKKTNIQ